MKLLQSLGLRQRTLGLLGNDSMPSFSKGSSLLPAFSQRLDPHLFLSASPSLFNQNKLWLYIKISKTKSILSGSDSHIIVSQRFKENGTAKSSQTPRSTISMSSSGTLYTSCKRRQGNFPLTGYIRLFSSRGLWVSKAILLKMLSCTELIDGIRWADNLYYIFRNYNSKSFGCKIWTLNECIAMAPLSEIH